MCKEHLKKDSPSYQGGSPYIYCAQEAQTIGDAGQSIPCIYAVLDNKQTYHQASIIDMEGNIFIKLFLF